MRSWYIITGLSIVIIAALSAIYPLAALGLLVVAALGYLFFQYPESGLILTILSVALGNLARVEIGPIALLPADIIIPVLTISWLLHKVVRHRHFTSSSTGQALSLWIIVALASLPIAWYLQSLSGGTLLSAALYLIRFIEYALLYYIALDLITPDRIGYYLRYLLYVGLFLCLAGFVQYWLIPDFSFMIDRGWDPHFGRLLSTFYDPNLLAAFLVPVIGITLSYALVSQEKHWWVMTIIMLAAFFLTLSRSGLVGLLVTVGLIGLIKSRTMLIYLLIAMLIGLATSPRLQQRVSGIFNIDTTANYRIESWKNGLAIARHNPITGVGYNTLPHYQIEEGWIKSAATHSASGTDSSLLNVLITTGIIGLLVYLYMLWTILAAAWRRWQIERSPLGLGLTTGLIGLIVSSLFVNALFYPFVLIYLWIFAALCQKNEG